MRVKHKGLEHEVTTKAPFVGAVINAATWKHRETSADIVKLKQSKNVVSTSEQIIEEILSKPFNEGIIFAGLEWGNQPVEFIDLFRLANEAGLKVMVYTGYSFESFTEKIGRAAAKHLGNSIYPFGTRVTKADDSIFSYIGGMVLDYHAKDDYLVACGLDTLELYCVKVGTDEFEEGLFDVVSEPQDGKKH